MLGFDLANRFHSEMDEKREIFSAFGSEFQLQQHTNHENQFKFKWNEMTAPFPVLPFRLSFVPVASTAHSNFPIDFSIQCVMCIRIRIQRQPHETASSAACTREMK